MRHDSDGLFWTNEQTTKASQLNVIPPIPDTGWRPPTYWPDLSSVKVMGIDVETYDPRLNTHGPGWARGDGHLVGISVAVPGAKWYFPMRHEVQPEFNMHPESVLAWARDQFGRAHQHKVGAHLMYDVGWLRQEGVHVAGPLHDVQNMAALLTENEPVALDYLGMRHLGVGKLTADLYHWLWLAYGGKRGESQRANIYRSPPSLAGPYAEDDADLPLRLAEVFFPMMQAQGLMDVYNMETELTPLLVDMRFAGVRIDLDRAKRLHDEMAMLEEKATALLTEIVGWKVNVGSANELAFAFDAMGLDYPRSPTQKPSFKKEFLKLIDHPAVKQVLEIRRLEKLRGTFVDGYMLGKNVNGRLHGTFNQLRGEDNGARSGRLSSQDPNLQNIPVRDPIGKLIREAFVPEYGHRDWAKIDLSQIEYRYLVHFAVGRGADQARSMYCNDPRTDYHDYTQNLVKEHTGKLIERRPIKNINFGLIFGMGEDKLAMDLQMPKAEASALFKHYHKAIPFARSTMDWAADEAKRNGTVATIMGRLSRFELYQPGGRGGRDLPGLRYEAALARYGADIELAYLHKALNRKLQGSAADAMKMAMVNAYRAGCFNIIMPRLTVHDELGFSMPGTPESEQALAETKWHMENAISLRVPVIAELTRGSNWGECG